MNEFLGQVTLSDLGIKEEETPKNAETYVLYITKG